MSNLIYKDLPPVERKRDGSLYRMTPTLTPAEANTTSTSSSRRADTITSSRSVSKKPGTVLSIGTFRSALFIDILTALLGIGLLSCVLLPKQEASNENVSVLSEIKAGIFNLSNWIRILYSSHVFDVHGCFASSSCCL